MVSQQETYSLISTDHYRELDCHADILRALALDVVIWSPHLTTFKLHRLIQTAGFYAARRGGGLTNT